MTKRKKPSPGLSPAKLREVPIAVIGMACLFPRARNLAEFWTHIVRKVDAITDVPIDRWDVNDYYDPDPKAPDKTYCKRGGFLPEIEFDPMEFGLPPNILEVTDVSQMLSLLVARDVLEDAGYGEAGDAERDGIGIVLGVGGGQKLITPLTARLQYPVWRKVLRKSGISERDTEIIIEKIKKAYIPWEENSFPGMLGNVIAGRIANRLNLGGLNCVVDAACASSLTAVKMAVSELVEYRSEVMIAGGVDTDNSIFMYLCFSKTPAFTDDERCRPFDEDSRGMMIGEGIGMVALKRLEDAERDGDRIYAVIRGIGASSDGRFNSIYNPRPEGQAKALRRAYEDAGIRPSTIGLVEAHGTGTRAGDPAEFVALKEVFGEDGAARQSVALGSVKSQIGHTKAAAGSAGLIKAVLALHHGILPPTINVEKPSGKLGIEDSPFYLNTETRPWIPVAEGVPRRAAVSSFGFGGTNFHVVLEEYPSERGEGYRLHDVPRDVLLAAPTSEDLLEECRTRLAELESGDGEEAHRRLLRRSAGPVPPRDHARVGFVSSSIDETRERLASIVARLQKRPDEDAWSLPKGVFYRRRAMDLEGGVVALFPGQGSQYPGMGKEVTCNFPPLMDAWREMDRLFVGEGWIPLSEVVFPRPTFDAAERRSNEERLRRTEFAQPAIGVLSYGLFKILERAGFRPDYAAGHSFGELTALWAAGVLEDADFFRLARARGRAMAAPDDPDFDAGGMLAVIGDVEEIQREVSRHPGITLANVNSRKEVVLAGPTESLHAVQPPLEERGWRVVPLSVSAAFHTPLVGHAQKPFAEAIEQASFRRPRCAVYSNTTGAAYPPEPEEIRKVLSGHILHPVLFREEIERIYEQGGRLFVEFGPRGVLSKLVENILEGRPHLAVALNPSPKRDSDEQLRKAVVQLRVAGLALGPFDPYGREWPAVERKQSLAAVKLTGSNFVREERRRAFEDSLNDGFQVEQAKPPAPADPERGGGKSVAEAASATVPVRQTAPPSGPVRTTEGIEEAWTRFYEHQQETLRLHERFLEGHLEYAKISYELIREQQSVLAAGPPASGTAGVERAMARFHEHQGETLRIHDRYLRTQAELSRMALEVMKAHGGTVAGASIPETAGDSHEARVPRIGGPAEGRAGAGTPPPSMPAGPPGEAPTRGPTLGKVRTEAPPRMETGPVPHEEGREDRPGSGLEGPAVEELTRRMLEVVSEKTGYPVEMLEPEMEMEADLGIDSIKRVEILGTLMELYPGLPEPGAEEMAELKTLGQIVAYLERKGVGGDPAGERDGGGGQRREKTPSGADRGALPPSGYAVVKGLPLPDRLEFSPPEGRICVVTDDGTPLTTEVVKGLREEGWSVGVVGLPASLVENEARLPPDVPRFELARVDEAAVKDLVGRLLDGYGPPGGFLHLQPPPVGGEGLEDLARRKGLLLAVFLLAKHLKPALCDGGETAGRGFFVTAARMNGMLGVGGGRFSSVDGGLFGLTKTLSLEWPSVFCRAVDLGPGMGPDEGARRILAETRDPNLRVVEVGHGETGRVTLSAVPDGRSGEAREDMGTGIDPSMVFVVSGGGRGITARCVAALAGVHPCGFLLVGRSPLLEEDPVWARGCEENGALKRRAMEELARRGEKATPRKVQALVGEVLAGREIRATLEAVRAAGGRAEYLSVDVTAEGVEGKIREAAERLGDLRGVIHGAGVLADKLIEKKTVRDFDAVFSTKVKGLETLLRCVEEERLDYLILFSSAAGFFGNPGQADYAAANEILNKFAHQFKARRPSCRVLSFNWGPWDGGMVTDSLKKAFADRKVDLIPVEGGTRRFVEGVSANGKGIQVVVGHGMRDGAGPAIRRPAPPRRITRVLREEENPFLRDHRIGDRAVLPAAAVLAWMAEGCEQLRPAYRFHRCEGYRILKGIVFDEEFDGRAVMDLREKEGAPEEGIDFEVSISTPGPRDRPVPRYAGRIRLVSGPIDTPGRDGPLWEPGKEETLEGRLLYENGTLFHGPSFRMVRAVTGIDEKGLHMWCRSPSLEERGLGRFEGAALDPYPVDALFQAMLVWARRRCDAASLPTEVGCLERFGDIPPGAEFQVVLGVKRQAGTGLVADVEAYDGGGRLCLRMIDAEVTLSRALNALFEKGPLR